MATTPRQNQLEFFLIRTFRSFERRFQPSRVRLSRRVIGKELGDVLISPTTQIAQMLPIIPRIQMCLSYRRNLDLINLQYTQVVIQLVLPSDSSAPKTLSYDGATFTFRNDFSGSSVLQITWNENSSTPILSSLNHIITLESRQWVQAVFYNKNKLRLINREGAITYLLLYGFVGIKTRSFSNKDILLSMAVSRSAHEDPFKLTLWRPLWFFWTDENFEQRLVAQEIAQLKHPLEQEAVLQIDRTLRFLIDRMIDRRKAINDHLVTLLIDVASNLHLNHPLLERLRQIALDLSTLNEIMSQAILPATLLNELIKFDLKNAVPIFRNQINQMCTDLGQTFSDQVQSALEQQGGASTQMKNSGMSLWNEMIEKLIWQAAAKLSSQPAPFDSQCPEAHDTGRDKPLPLSLKLSADEDSTNEQIQKLYTETLLCSMPKFAAKWASNHPNTATLTELATLLSYSEGHLERGRQIVCWKTCGELSQESPSGLSTSLVFIDLAGLENSLLREAELPKDPTDGWKKSLKLPESIIDSRLIDFCDGEFFLLNRTVLTVVKFTPEVSRKLYQLPESGRIHFSVHLTSLDCTYFHHALCYSPQFRMILFADVQSKIVECAETSIGIALQAFGFDNSERLSLVASQKYPSPCIPPELSLPWETPNRFGQQEHSPHTFNLPFSPLRWCTTKRNLYCLWLLSPQSHFVYGLKNSRFVILSSRQSYSAATIEPMFILPAILRDSRSGMCPLLAGKKSWDHQNLKYDIIVYRIQLRKS